MAYQHLPMREAALGIRSALNPPSEGAERALWRWPAIGRDRRACGVRPACTVNSAAWMGGRRREKQPRHRSLRPRESWHGPEDQLLADLAGPPIHGAVDEVPDQALEIRGQHHVLDTNQ